MTDSPMTITAVDADDDRHVLRNLLEAFHGWMNDNANEAYDTAAELAEDLRSLEREAESRAWIARFDGTPAGCVLLYGVTEDLAEFKRLWVSPEYRGEGIGRALTRTVIDEARMQAYETLGLTTPPWSEAAHALYQGMGFERTPPYPETRLPERYHDDAIFMQLDLEDFRTSATDE